MGLSLATTELVLSQSNFRHRFDGTLIFLSRQRGRDNRALTSSGRYFIGTEP